MSAWGLGITDRILCFLPAGETIGRLQDDCIAGHAVQDVGEGKDADRAGVGDGNPEGVLRSRSRQVDRRRNRVITNDSGSTRR